MDKLSLVETDCSWLGSLQEVPIRSPERAKDSGCNPSCGVRAPQLTCNRTIPSGGVKVSLGQLKELRLPPRELNLSQEQQFPAMSESRCFHFLGAPADLSLSRISFCRDTGIIIILSSLSIIALNRCSAGSSLPGR